MPSRSVWTLSTPTLRRRWRTSPKRSTSASGGSRRNARAGDCRGDTTAVVYRQTRTGELVPSTKPQTNVRLSEEAREALLALAKRWGDSASGVVERLIRKE